MSDIIQINQAPRGINWRNVFVVGSIHLLAIPAAFMFSWKNLFTMLILNWVVGGLGIGIGYHRLLTHRSFKAPKWLEYLLTAFGTLAVQDGPIKWVATHRIHHAFVETVRDPHTSRAGFWWSQIGWVLWGAAQDHDATTLKRYVPDLLKDRGQRLIERFYVVPLIVSGVVLFALGGWPLVFWGVFVRVVFGWHTTWFVNSLSHLYGKRPFDTGDDSTNNWFVALLTFGEGWHNAHHAFPTSARHGLKWYQFDLNWITIRLFKKLGWATDIRVYEEKVAAAELKRAA